MSVCESIKKISPTNTKSVKIKRELMKESRQIKNKKNGLFFKDHLSYAQFNRVLFSEDAHWKLSILLMESGDSRSSINFFFGERGTRTQGVARINDCISFRVSNGDYISGIPYIPGNLINLTIEYNQGYWLFSDGVNEVKSYCKNNAVFNAIGSGYNGHEHEKNTTIFSVKINQYKEGYIEEIGNWDLDENGGCLAFDTSNYENHAILSNASWVCSSKKHKQVTSDPLELCDWKKIANNPMVRGEKYPFLDRYIQAERDILLWNTLDSFIKSNEIEKGNDIINNEYHFDRFQKASLPKKLLWNEDPFNNRSWQWQYHQINFYLHLLVAHSKTGEDKYLDKLFNIIVGWEKAHFNKKPPSEMSWNDHVVALRLRSFLYIWEYVKESEYCKSEEFLSLILRLVEAHCDILSSVKFYNKHNNHGFDQSLFLYMASVKFKEFKNSKSWKKIAFHRLLDEIGVAFSPDGMHIENSPSYLSGMIHRVQLAKNTINHYEPEREINLDVIINNSLMTLAYLLRPDGSLPMIGDTDLGTKIYSFNEFKRLSSFRLFQHAQTLGNLGGIGSSPPSKVFPSAGYAIFKNAWRGELGGNELIHMVFKCGHLSSFHRHDDDLSFVLWGLGEDWFVDGGIYKYDEKDKYRRYLRSAAAHNCPVVDTEVVRGVSDNNSSMSRIIDYSDNNLSMSVTGESHMFRGYTVERNIQYILPNKFIITDSVHRDSGEQNERYNIMFHVPMDKNIIIKEGAIQIHGKLESFMEMLFVGDCEYTFDVFSGYEELEMMGWQSKNVGEVSPIQTIRCSVAPRSLTSKSRIELKLGGSK